MLVGSSFFRRNDEHWLTDASAGLAQTPALGFAQHLLRVLQHPGGGDNVICGHVDFHLVVAEFQGELAAPEKLLVLPGAVIRIGGHAGIPLGQGIKIGVGFREALVAASSAHGRLFDDVERPVHGKLHLPPRRQRLRQIDAQHGIHDDMGQIRIALTHPLDLVAVGIVRHGLIPADPIEAVGGLSGFGMGRRSFRTSLQGIRAEAVLIQLQPEIAQSIGRGVGVANGRRAGNPAPPFVEAHLNAVVGPLLPIGAAGGAGGVAIGIGRGQQGAELAKLSRRILRPSRGGQQSQETGATKNALEHRRISPPHQPASL